MDAEQLIGRHFKLKHLIWSNTAKNKSINNMPGIDGSPSQTRIIENLRALMVNVVDDIVDIYPNLIINSGYRCIKLNRSIGGSSTSQHVYGQAVDLSLPGLTSAELYNHIYTNISSWDQLIWEFPERGKRSWVHVSYSSRRRRKTTLASDIKTYHDLYGGKRCGSTNQYQHGINDAKIV
jgi:zinc D-Ala-D-Ala carboxypeptidase